MDRALVENKQGTSMAKASTPEPVGKGGPLWKTPGLHLPPYIQHVANDLIPKHGESKAVEMAVGIVKNWRDGHDGKGHKVTADTQAAATKAIAEWEADKAKAHLKETPAGRLRVAPGELSLVEAGMQTTSKPWNGDAGRFSDEEYKRSCLVTGDGKDDSHLPIREPDGTINTRAMSAAAAALAGARGGTKIGGDARKKAARTLLSLHRKLGMDPPASLERTAGQALAETAVGRMRIRTGTLIEAKIDAEDKADKGADEATESDPKVRCPKCGKTVTPKDGKCPTDGTDLSKVAAAMKRMKAKSSSS